MCGFVGFTGFAENKRRLLHKMMARIIHRGPDMGDVFEDNDIALGFRRLSIIDLSENGKQPMANEDGTVVVVFNGEIYNFASLREELLQKGHVFKTQTDTEVIVHGYEEYGTDLVGKLRGMFAFVVWDQTKKRLFGARDYFGVKPFYYGTLSNGEMIFGSEIKAFLDHPLFVKEVEKDALRAYLTLQYSAQTMTFFKGVYKLPPAHFFTYQDGKLQIERYWEIQFKEDSLSFEESVEAIDKAVNESVEAHKISDVKVGAFLSGGVDSSYITAAQKPDETFSVGFDYHKFNETDYAAELSKRLHIQNYKQLLNADECFDAFPDIQYHMDEPQSNPSCVPLYFLAKLASEHVTVVLSGEGADEIFAGYETYDVRGLSKKYRKVPKALRLTAAKAAAKLPYFKGHDFIIKNGERPQDYYLGQACIFTDKEALSILSEDCRHGRSAKAVADEIYQNIADKSELVQKQMIDLLLWLPGDILLKADKMSMAHSLELRVPYLDKEIMHMAAGIPDSYKINGIDTKYVFRKAANKTIPDDWANREKKGFPVPIRYWLREEKYYNLVKTYFEADYAAIFFDQKQILALLENHYQGKENCQRKIWTVFTFLVWYKRFFVDDEATNAERSQAE
ncbi:MAG: asparagine synthase (glutamine-hydrolyzing) [Clostridiales bacterium]|nr:asparagine synthase (glutamine-hydrolyzing) [Clostridiales bacterium]